MPMARVPTYAAKLRFDTQILTEPNLSASVVRDATEGESVNIVGFHMSRLGISTGFAVINLGDDVVGEVLRYVRQDAVSELRPPRGAKSRPPSQRNPSAAVSTPAARSVAVDFRGALLFATWCWVALSVIGLIVLIVNVPGCEEVGYGKDCDTRNAYWVIAVSSGISAFFFALVMFSIYFILEMLARLVSAADQQVQLLRKTDRGAG